MSWSDVQKTSRATLGSTVNTCTASASWGCWKGFHVFLRDGVLGSLRSIPVLLSGVNGEVCTDNASVACPRWFTWTFGHYFYEPSHLAQQFFNLEILRFHKRGGLSGELNHALSQLGCPTQSQLSRPMSSGHHISMVHRPRRTHLQ